MSDLNKLIDEVLELDMKATPGPWQITEYEDVICHHTLHDGQKVIGERFREIPDIQFCALARTAAPILARGLKALCKNHPIRNSEFHSKCPECEYNTIAEARIDFVLKEENTRLREALQRIAQLEFQRGQTVNLDNSSYRLSSATGWARVALEEK